MGALDKVSVHEVHKMSPIHKQLLTWALYLATISYGLIINVIGPVLHDLTHKYDSTIEKMSFIFMCFYLGYFIGAVLNSITFNYVNRHLSLVAILLVMTATVVAIPFSPSIPVMFVITFIAGYGTGGLDTALVVWIVEIWAEKSSIYMGGYQLFFAMGIVLGPVLAQPFVSADNLNQQDNLLNNSFISQETYTENTQSYGKIHIPFIILGVLLSLSAVLLLALHIWRRYEPPRSNKPSAKFALKCPKPMKLTYVVLLVLTVGPYVGFEFMTFQLLPTYLINSHLKMSQKSGDFELTIMTVAFLIYCALSFIVSLKYWSKNSIYINWLTILIGNIVILIFTVTEASVAILRVGSVFVGIGLSTLYPSVFAFVESQIKISNIAGGLCVCACGLFSAIFPVICGQYINTYPLVLPIMNIVLGACGLAVFITLDMLLQMKVKSSPSKSDLILDNKRPSMMSITKIRRMSYMGHELH